MSSTDIERYDAIEQVVIAGDLAKLAPTQRVEYYRKVCESVGLNPYTQPFNYITLNGKLTLYARKDATDQLRRIHGISITRLESETIQDVYCVTAHATARDGRQDQDTGAVYIGSLKGEALANAIMKARTKAKRRVTLSIAGLGWLDETEVDSIPDAQRIVVKDTGEILDAPDEVEFMQPEPRKGTPPTQARLDWMHALGTRLYGPDWEERRHKLAESVSKGAVTSSKELSAKEVETLIKGMEKKETELHAPVTEPAA